ncbi:MAG: RimK family protein [Gemmatimonadota bacterium]|nr:RimK family protein [Gemmatimonadota bacterium]
MARLIVVERPERWPFEIPGVRVVAARDYLTSASFAELPRATVINVCRSYSKNTTGYYVSLLAEARGHRALPSVTTVQGLLVDSVVRVVSDDLDRLIQTGLRPLRSDRFEMSVYFGRNLAKRYERLARALFMRFPIPLMRARFDRDGDAEWTLSSVRAVPASDVPDAHRPFVVESAARFFRRPHVSGSRRKHGRFDIAILWSEDDAQAPSDAAAIRKFVRAADRAGVKAEIIEPDDFGRLEIYDALFIRETTHIGHHTHRFALRAAAAGLVVIDDPESIVRCTNKVFQAELFERHGIPSPKTLIVHEGNRDAVVREVGLPCVLKDPTSAFSLGVVKVATEAELVAGLDSLLAESELVIAQEWTPTDFDWRIGVLGGRVIFASRYHMARGHWQIVRHDAPASGRYGRVESVPLEDVPERVMELALAATDLIGKGLYGVDVKVLKDGRALVTEVNDNPNIDAGCEDGALGDGLYDLIIGHFVEALEARASR